MSRDHDPIFPLELWVNVMHYCSSETLKVLLLVSRACHEEARRRLYRTLYFEHGSRHNARRPGTRIYDLSKFRRSLSIWPGWRSAVHEVQFRWTTNGTAYCWKEPERSETEAEMQLNRMVRETATLLAESTVLRDVHLSIPRLDPFLVAGVERIDSLDIPMTDCLHNDPDFPALLRLFQVPSLGRVTLRQMLRLNCTIPDSCRQPGTSHVRSLSFSQCGPVSPEVAHLLSWSENLQCLDFEIDLADGLNRFAYDSGTLSHAKVREALWPVEHCLQELNVDILDDGDGWLGGPLQGNAFQSFKKLHRLSVPLGMFMEFVDSNNNNNEPVHDSDLGLPLWTRLPGAIQELTLKLDRDFWWGGGEPMEASPETKQLVAYLAALGQHNRVCCPELRELRISIQTRHSAKGAANRLPLELQETQDLIDELQSSGIAVSFE